ncbi:MAG: SRPBCC domain-containing protein [Alphaproteobacteria bacterium]|nr:SRPBCC domain-containing protein [Alphaproteobacteria bacterium]MBV9421059.1 SRPBCC domain-containing protein [Alphaproteobacteria bacterium]MBV9542408.1 SRPBCC domain-containing protein [Alphaproteobacteria bacterium]MBV9904704.1 SRPBCC domain-containing protein [Alphaproteobacteria bacterium]
MADINYQVHYEQPPEAVWRAITDPKLIEKWLMPNNFRPELGAEFEFRSKPVYGWDGIARCKVLEIEPPKRLVYSWNSNKIETVVSYTLDKDAHGTWLRFAHTGFSGVGGFMAKMFMGPGWREKLNKAIPKLLVEA